jgi:hypothetical protein
MAKPAHAVARHFSFHKPSTSRRLRLLPEPAWMDAGPGKGKCRDAESFRHHVMYIRRVPMFAADTLLRFVPADYKPRLTAHAMAEQHSAYDDPHTPLHSKKPLQSVLKKLVEREKKPPKSYIPLTKRNLEEFHNPNYSDTVDAEYIQALTYNASLTVRKVSVHEWLRLLP